MRKATQSLIKWPLLIVCNQIYQRTMDIRIREHEVSLKVSLMSCWLCTAGLIGDCPWRLQAQRKSKPFKFTNILTQEYLSLGPKKTRGYCKHVENVCQYPTTSLAEKILGEWVDISICESYFWIKFLSSHFGISWGESVTLSVKTSFTDSSLKSSKSWCFSPKLILATFLIEQ